MAKFLFPIIALSLISLAGEAQNLGCSAKERTSQFDLHNNVLDTSKSRGLADNYYLWDNGATIRVKFLTGSPALQNRVFNIAKQWENYANLKFVKVSDNDADIRVKLGTGSGHNSYIGIVSRMIPEYEETMNLDTVDMAYSDSFFVSVILHEFGHAIGLMHEHSSPVSGIKWNKEYMYKLYKIQQGWSKEDVDYQVFRVLSNSYTNGTKYDPHSIMHYPIDAKETLDGFSVGWNYVLSKGDKEIIKALYPKKGKRKEKVVKVEVSNFKGIDLEVNEKKGGISIYPSMNVKNKGTAGTINFMVKFYDEDGYPLYDTDNQYNDGYHVAVTRRVFFSGNKSETYNKNNKKKKKHKDFELFIPFDQIPLNDVGNEMIILLKVIAETPDGEMKNFYQSDALVYRNIKKPN